MFSKTCKYQIEYGKTESTFSVLGVWLLGLVMTGLKGAEAPLATFLLPWSELLMTNECP